MVLEFAYVNLVESESSTIDEVARASWFIYSRILGGGCPKAVRCCVMNAGAMLLRVFGLVETLSAVLSLYMRRAINKSFSLHV